MSTNRSINRECSVVSLSLYVVCQSRLEIVYELINIVLFVQCRRSNECTSKCHKFIILHSKWMNTEYFNKIMQMQLPIEPERETFDYKHRCWLHCVGIIIHYYFIRNSLDSAMQFGTTNSYEPKMTVVCTANFWKFFVKTFNFVQILSDSRTRLNTSHCQLHVGYSMPSDYASCLKALHKTQFAVISIECGMRSSAEMKTLYVRLMLWRTRNVIHLVFHLLRATSMRFQFNCQMNFE